ncbi:RNA-directed DNA methylation 4 [Gossypium australe]|uniref:Probable RNA polymerase II nuclear localization protein SLC7A6OS n=1 Tax=Gossypium australe TaxID=47621 RepID=A0A5B6UEW5_9ROSI|nr:RNA-directed DNA methylation 4 [Gossypium australe]
MASNGESSSTPPQSTTDRPVIVRVKRKPNSADVTDSNTKSQEGRRPQKTNYEIAKNARFEQIWRSRRGKKEAVDEMYHFYDVMQIEEESLEDRELLSSYLPLLREFIPAAAAEIESDVRAYMFETDADGYVYDYYTVKNDMDVGEEDMASNPFPLVKVDDEDFYDVPYESEYDSEDSNAEDNPRNDYPDETSEEEEEDEDEDEETKASDQSEGSSKSSEVGSVSGYDEDLLYEVDPYDDINGDSNHLGHGNSDYDTDGEDWRWSYR